MPFRGGVEPGERGPADRMGEDDRALLGPCDRVGDLASRRRDDELARWKDGVSRKWTEEIEVECGREGVVDMVRWAGTPLCSGLGLEVAESAERLSAGCWSLSAVICAVVRDGRYSWPVSFSCMVASARVCVTSRMKQKGSVEDALQHAQTATTTIPNSHLPSSGQIHIIGTFHPLVRLIASHPNRAIHLVPPQRTPNSFLSPMSSMQASSRQSTDQHTCNTRPQVILMIS